MLNETKAERNRSASPNPEMVTGLGQSGDPQHCSATSLLRIRGCPSAKGAEVVPSFSISWGLTAGRPRMPAAIYNEWPPPLQSGCSPPAPVFEVLMEGDVPACLIPLRIAGGPPRVAHTFPTGHIYAWRGLVPSSLSDTSTSSFFCNYSCQLSRGSG